jgi:hypothetical protein
MFGTLRLTNVTADAVGVVVLLWVVVMLLPPPVTLGDSAAG